MRHQVTKTVISPLCSLIRSGLFLLPFRVDLCVVVNLLCNRKETRFFPCWSIVVVVVVVVDPSEELGLSCLRIEISTGLKEPLN